MKTSPLYHHPNFQLLTSPQAHCDTPTGITCCDLLSLCLHKVQPRDAWITVMSNLNTLAVAVHKKVACVIISEGVLVSQELIQTAANQKICLLKTSLSTYQAAKILGDLFGL